MPSKLSALFRSLILLAFLVGLPFMAVTGTGPDSLIDWLVDSCAERLEGRADRGETEYPDAGRNAVPAPGFGGSPAGAPDNQISGPMAYAMEDPRTRPSHPARGATTPDVATRHGDGATSPPPTGVSRRAPPAGGPTAAPAAGNPVGTPASVAPVIDTVEAVEQRLRLLGASYYLLERWGHPRLLYRFQCRMPINDDPNHYTQFQAIDDQPLQAMQDVLRRVEAWQSTATASAPDPHTARRVPRL